MLDIEGEEGTCRTKHLTDFSIIMEPTNSGGNDDDDGGAFEIKWDSENTLMSSLSMAAIVLAVVISVTIIVIFTVFPKTRVVFLDCSNPKPKKSMQERRAAFIKAETERCSTKLGAYGTPAMAGDSSATTSA